MATLESLTRRRLLCVAAMDVMIFTIGVLAASGHLLPSWFLAGGSTGREWLSLAVGCIAIISFFGFLPARREPQQPVRDEASLRFAIAAALLLVYLLVIGVTAFYGPIEKSVELHPLTQQIIGSFTAVIGIVVAFFFGASAYVDAGRKKDEPR